MFPVDYDYDYEHEHEHDEDTGIALFRCVSGVACASMTPRIPPGNIMTSLGRIVGLDVGDVRIGVAVSDPLRLIAQPHSVITRAEPEKDVAAVCTLIGQTEAVRVVVGLPLNREGKPGPQAEKVLQFIEQLRAATTAEIVTQDERFSTAAAERMLIAADVRRKKRKGIVDKIAAHHILQTHLDRIKRT